MKNLKIVHYDDKYWNLVKEFIENNWRKDHPMCNEELSNWQYRGFGKNTQKHKTFLLFDNSELIGFRGTIPALFQVPLDEGEMKIVTGGSSSMWSIDKRYRNGKLGLMLLNEAIKTMDVITGLGSDPRTSLPFYKYTGFNILDSMHRYIGPLQAKLYASLLPSKSNYSKIYDWSEKLTSSVDIVEPSDPNINKIASIWKTITFPLKIFSLYRNTDFWRWRYLESEGYNYLFFGDPESTGVIVARVEDIISKDKLELNGRKVFRIIEIIPNSDTAWLGEVDFNLVGLLKGAIKWASNQECVAVDFYCSTKKFEDTLFEVGLKKFDINDTLCCLAVLFQPLKHMENTTNVFCKVNVEGSDSTNVFFDNTYMVKSDGDMDRPNILKR